MRGSPRRTIVAWTLYDFANSAFSAIVYATVFPAYYANTVVGNADGRGDFWWGLIVSVSMAVVALITSLEEQLGIVVDDDEIDGATFETIGTLTDFVAGKLAA